MAYRLNVDLPLLIPEFNEESRVIIRAIDGLRRKRNDIVHSGESATTAEAGEAIKSANDFVKLLGRHCLYSDHWVGDIRLPD
jgi:hypothetical protein